MNRKTLIGLLAALFLFAAAAMSAEDPASPQTAPAPQDSSHGRAFVDLDGDGFNDLAPDSDGDGIPDGLDPDVDNGRHCRWAWFRSIPDSARDDTTNFHRWWDETGRMMDWRQAWRRWNMMRDRFDPESRGPWWMRDDFNPRDRRFNDDPHERGRRGHRAGDPGDDGGHRGGHDNGGGSGR